MPVRLVGLMCIALLFLSGCSSLSVTPKNGDTITATQSPENVAVQAAWPDGNLVTGPTIDVDAQTLPSQSVTVGSAGANATVPLPAGSHSVRVRLTEKCWYCSGGTSQFDVTNNFTVNMPASVATVSLAFASTPPNPIDVPRDGNSANLSFNVQRANTTSGFAVNSSGLPTDVSMAPATVTFPPGSASATLAAKRTAHGSSSAAFTVKPTTGTSPTASVSNSVRVIPAAGVFAFQQAPQFTNGGGPQTPSSPDGKFGSSVTRMGASRIWTYSIINKSNNQTVFTTNVTNKTTGPSASNLGGLVFCSQVGQTTTAIVFDDINEDPTPIAGPSYDYRHNVKVILLAGTAPQLRASFEVRFQNSAVPRIGFSPDCSIIAGWGASTGINVHRAFSFTNGLSGTNGAGFEYDEATTSGFTGTASVSGANIVSTGGGQTSTNAAPQ